MSWTLKAGFSSFNVHQIYVDVECSVTKMLYLIKTVWNGWWNRIRAAVWRQQADEWLLLVFLCSLPLISAEESCVCPASPRIDQTSEWMSWRWCCVLLTSLCLCFSPEKLQKKSCSSLTCESSKTSSVRSTSSTFVRCCWVVFLRFLKLMVCLIRLLQMWDELNVWFMWWGKWTSWILKHVAVRIQPSILTAT